MFRNIVETQKKASGKNRKKAQILSIGVALIQIWTAETNAEIVGSGMVNNKLYFADVVHNGTRQQVILRRYWNMCSRDDIVFADVAAQRTTLGTAARAICTAKTWYDNGRTVAGCLATAATVGCATAVAVSDGAAAAFCGAVLDDFGPYTLRRGARDCVLGLRDQIAQSMLGDRNYAAIGLSAGLTLGKWKDATGKAIDLACSQIK